MVSCESDFTLPSSLSSVHLGWVSGPSSLQILTSDAGPARGRPAWDRSTARMEVELVRLLNAHLCWMESVQVYWLVVDGEDHSVTDSSG